MGKKFPRPYIAMVQGISLAFFLVVGGICLSERQINGMTQTTTGVKSVNFYVSGSEKYTFFLLGNELQLPSLHKLAMLGEKDAIIVNAAGIPIEVPLVFHWNVRQQMAGDKPWKTRLDTVWTQSRRQMEKGVVLGTSLAENARQGAWLQYECWRGLLRTWQ